MKKEVVWDELVVLQMERQLDYIKETSILQAEKVREYNFRENSRISNFFRKTSKRQIQNGKRR